MALPAASGARDLGEDLLPAGAPPVALDPALVAAENGAGKPTSSPARPVVPASPGRPLVVVGLGDSVVSAAHCDCAGFVSAYADLLTAAGTPATSVNLGVPGATTEDMLAQIQGDQRTRQVLRTADVVVIMSGANEAVPVLESRESGECEGACYDATAAATRSELTTAVSEVRALRGSAPVQVALVDYWNVTVDGQVAKESYDASDLAEADRATEVTNEAICGAAADSGAACVDTFIPFRGADGAADPTALLAPDGDHPDAAGHQVIARALAAALPAH